jgi:hypothetical protein
MELPRNFWIGMLLTIASGKPFDISTGLDDNLDSVANDRPPGITRNTGRGSGLAQLDLRLSKLFSVPRPFNGLNQNKKETATLGFSIDMFNALNHTNPTDFIGAQSSPFFGRANSALPARTIQLSLKYKF